MLNFEIVSWRTADGNENDKKFVAYMVQARQDGPQTDPDPSFVERRYTDFLELYNGLKSDFPTMINSFSFPRKIIMGNFDPSLITTRCTAFESLLKLVANESRIRESPVAISFFQDKELNDARKLLDDGSPGQALHVLEISFKFLNKVYTDRARVVLVALCRIVACATVDANLAVSVEKWAQLALKRYEAVSDFDLLAIYIPLLHTCISIWDALGRDKSQLVEELSSLRKRGMKVDSVPSLIEALDNVNTTIL